MSDYSNDVYRAAGCAVNKENHLEQLKLALAWNRIDVAKDNIFSAGASFKVCCLIYCSASKESSMHCRVVYLFVSLVLSTHTGY